eukprot:gene13899-16398_t
MADAESIAKLENEIARAELQLKKEKAEQERAQQAESKTKRDIMIVLGCAAVASVVFGRDYFRQERAQKAFDEQWESLPLFFALLSLTTMVHGDLGQVVGEVNIDADVVIRAVDVETNIKIVVDQTIIIPKISFALSRGSASLDDFVNAKSVNEVIIGMAKSSESQSSIDHFNAANRPFAATSMLFAMFFACLSFVLGSGQRSSIRSLVFCVGVMALVGGVYSLNFADLTVEATLKVPLGFKFNSITIHAGKGSLDMGGLSADTVNINACNNNDFPIKIISGVQSSLTICSQSPVILDDFQAPSNAKINVTTSSTIDVEFFAGYTGSVHIETLASSPAASISGDCSVTSSTSGSNSVKSGTCSGSSSASLHLVGLAGVTVAAVVTCPTTATWREPVAPVNGPASGPIASQSPAIVSTWPLISQWKYKDMWSSGNLLEFTQTAGSSSNGVDTSSAFKITLNKWHVPNFWVITRNNNTLAMRAGLNYNFKVDVLPGTDSDIIAVSVCILDDYDVEDGTWIPNTEEPGFNQYVTCQNLTGSALSQTAWTTLSSQFSVPRDIYKGALAVRIYANHGNVPRSYYINKATYTVPQRAIVTPTLLTKDSELVKLRKPTPGLDAQDTSTCAYKATDLKHWHDATIWPGGIVPSPSSSITLPNNTRVLVSSCSLVKDAVYSRIYVPPTSELVFNDVDMTLHVQDLYIEGKLWMGSAKCRLNAHIEIIFHGAKTTTDTLAKFLGSKGIAVSSAGFATMQGKQFAATWTRLAATAHPDEYVIYLMDDVNWEVGQSIVITTSRWFDEWTPENEVLEIAAIQGRAVQLKTPIKFLHYAGTEYQAEVALLSRRIVLRGADDSVANSFGGHVIATGASQFAGLQLIRMGQRNMRARYPLHFHLAGHQPTSFITDCSVSESYYRCYTIHGTHDLLVSRNVAYNVNGHCYYIEDGIEENNTISYNIAAYVHTIGLPAAGGGQGGEEFDESDDLRQPADAAAAGFYITNAYNRIFGNAASGGWASYSFPNLPKPIGNSKNVDMSPESRPNLEFDGNSAHSAGYFFAFGSCVYCGGKLTLDSTTNKLHYKSGRESRETVNAAGEDTWMRYTNLKSFLCSDGLGHWGDRLEVDGYESTDSHRSGTVFGSAWINNAIINGQSGNPVSEVIDWQDRQGFQFYDTYTQTILTNINFRNYQPDPRPDRSPQQDYKVLVSMTHSDVYKPQGISAVRAISHTNVNRSMVIGHEIQDTGSSRYYNFIDWDGTASLRPGAARLIGSHLNWWQFDDTCAFEPTWNVWVCTKTPGREVGNIDFLIPGVIDPNVSFDDGTDSKLGNSTLFGPGIPASPRRTAYITNNMGITGVTNLGWYLNFVAGSPKSFKISTKLIPYGTYIIVALSYPANTKFTAFSDWEWGGDKEEITSVASLDLLKSSAGGKYYFNNAHLFIKVVDPTLTGAATEYFERGQVKIYDIVHTYQYSFTATCPNNNCAAPDTVPSWTA